jgi:hypothetical protein
MTEFVVVAVAARDPLPISGLIWSSMGAVGLLVLHVSFRIGRPVSRWQHPGHMIGVHVLGGFAALPMVLAAGSISAICVIDWVFRPDPPVVPWPYLPFMVMAGVCCLWSFKEFGRPTLSRTPSWLHERMARDPELRQVVYGKRPFR